MPDGRPWPRITIVTPSFEQAEFLEEAIRSVLLQGYPELEYIVLDGGSSDGTAEILRRYDPWLTFSRSAPDGGQVDALNDGFSRATGHWHAWLNSDDLYEPGVLQRVGAAPESASWVVGETGYVDESSRRIGRFPLGYRPRGSADDAPWVDVLRARASGTALPQQSSFWTAAAHRAAGELDASLEFTFDHEFWVRLSYAGYEPLLIDAEFARYRRHRGQKTRPLTRAASSLEEAGITQRWVDRSPDKHRALVRAYRRACVRDAWIQKSHAAAVRLAGPLAHRRRHSRPAQRNDPASAAVNEADVVLHNSTDGRV